MKVSVIIPVYNDAILLAKCLSALHAQTMDQSEFEIIVVDNGSTDHSRQIAARYADKLLESPVQRNPYPARNLGIQKSSGSLIALLDAKCIPSPNYLVECVSGYESGESVLYACNICFEFSEKPNIGEYVDALVFVPARESILAKEGVPGGSLFFHRSLIDDIGYFREDIRSGADGEWSARVWKAGLKVGYLNSAIVHYPGRKLSLLLKKGKRTGKGHFQLAQHQPSFNFINWYVDSFLRMRPPSTFYLTKCIKDRLDGRQIPFSRFRIRFAIWLYRVAHSFGRLGL